MAKTWLPSYDLLVGTKPDADLADDLQIAVSRVTARRVKLGILPWRDMNGSRSADTLSADLPPSRSLLPRRRQPPRKRGPRVYTASVVAPFAHLVGTMRDRELAVLVPCSWQTVAAYRRTHGIPHYVSSKLDAVIPLLGTAPDRDLSRRFDIPNSVVFRARRSRGIPVCRREVIRKSLPVALDAAAVLEDKSPHGFTVAELAAALNRHPPTLRSVFCKWSADGWFEQVGQFGRNTGRASEIRWRRADRSDQPDAPTIDLSVLGTMTDHDAARLLRVSVSRIWHTRKKNKIHAYKKPRARKEPT